MKQQAPNVSNCLLRKKATHTDEGTEVHGVDLKARSNYKHHKETQFKIRSTMVVKGYEKDNTKYISMFLLK